MSIVEWKSEEGRKLSTRDQGADVVCPHPMDFKGSESDCERENEDHDGFFEPWSHRKLGVSQNKALEITVGFLAVRNSNIPGNRIFELPNKLLKCWDLTESAIIDWANFWWTQGEKESTNYIPKFVLYNKPIQSVTDVKENCNLLVELTENSGPVAGRFGYSTFSEERAQLTLNLKDKKEEYRKHTVVHEFGHILGLKHEHQRADFWQGLYRFTDFNTIGTGGEQFSERKETKGIYDDYTTYDPQSVMHYYWRLEYFKEPYRKWFESRSRTGKLEPESTTATKFDSRKVEIAKKRRNFEISATEEMVLMSMCDQLHKVRTLKYLIEYNKGANSEWVLATQLESKDDPLPTEPEDTIPEKSIKAWKKLANGQLKEVTILKVEYIAGPTDSGSCHISDDGYTFVVKPSTKDIKLVNWAYNTSKSKPPKPYSVPKPPPPVIQPTTSGKGLFKIHLEPFQDKSCGGLGNFKVIVISGNPIKYGLAPTMMQISDEYLQKTTRPGKTNESLRVFVAHTEDASELKEAKDIEVTTRPSVEPDKDDCYYIFIRLYAPASDGKIFRDSATVPLIELKLKKKAMLCYKNLKKRAKSEIEVAMSAPNAILSKSDAREQLRGQVVEVLMKDINLPEIWIKKYEDGPLNKNFVQELENVMEFLFLFRGRCDLPFQLIEKIGVISSDLKNDIALYKAACEAGEHQAVDIAKKEFEHNRVSSDSSDPWRFGCDENFRRDIPKGYSRLRVSIQHKEKRYLFERLMKLVRALSGIASGKIFYAHEMSESDQGAGSLDITFLVALSKDKDSKKPLLSFKDKLQLKAINDIGIVKVVQISCENKETEIYSAKNQSDNATKSKGHSGSAKTSRSQYAGSAAAPPPPPPPPIVLGVTTGSRIQPDSATALKSESDITGASKSQSGVTAESRIQFDSAEECKEQVHKAPATVDSEREREKMLSLLSSMKKPPKCSRTESDSETEFPTVVLQHAPKWKDIAKDLGFSDNRIERIELDYLHPERCLYIVIWKWLHNNKWKDDKICKPTVDNLKILIKSVSTV